MQDDSNKPVWLPLVRLALKGSLPAFDALVTRFRPAVTTVCRGRCSHVDQIDDMVQTVFVSAYLHLSSLREPETFPAWLYAIARNAASQPKEREEAGHDLDELVLAMSQTIGQRQWRHIDERLSLDPVIAALDDLPEPLALPARLVYLHHWSVGEVADFLDLPVTTVKWRLHSARRSLRACFPELLPTP